MFFPESLYKEKSGKKKKTSRGSQPDRLSEVRSRENALGVLQSLNLVHTRLLADLVVLDEEVAVGVELVERGLDVGELGLLERLLLLGGLELHVQLRLGGLLGRDAANLLLAVLLGLAHEALVVLLGGLLLVLGLGDVGLELLGEHLHEPDDAVALAVLLLVRAPRLRRRRRGGVILHAHLGEDGL